MAETDVSGSVRRQQLFEGTRFPPALKRIAVIRLFRIVKQKKTQAAEQRFSDRQYTVFGRVTEGLEIVKAIQGVATDSAGRPLEDVRIIRAEAVRK